MKILFLDDDHQRIKRVKEQCIGHELFIAETAKEAITQLESAVVFDVVSLDHDLGGETMVTSGNGTGYEVAVFIGQMKIPPQRVIIHSFNPVGAKTMWHALPHIPELAIAQFGSSRYLKVLLC